MYPWQDYSGRLSPLKLAVFVALFLPGLWTAIAFGMGLAASPARSPRRSTRSDCGCCGFLFIALGDHGRCARSCNGRG